MAVPTTNIKMSDINAEQAGVDSTSLNALSTTGAITTGQQVATIDGTAPHGMNEFAGYIHTNLGDFPALTSWSTRQNRTVSTGSTIQASAHVSMSFRNLTNSNRIEVSWYGGTNANFSTIYTDYIDYSGYTGDINVSYTYPATHSGSNFYPGSTVNPMVNIGTSTQYPPYGWPGHASNTATTLSLIHI